MILPVLNERAVIERTLASLTGQQLAAGDSLEVLVIDGGSTDGSQDIVRNIARHDPAIRLIPNPHRTAPHAFNLGLAAARGEYVCILGAHCRYASDYIAVCLRELELHGAVGCSGRVFTRPAGSTIGAMLAYWAMGHPFAVSSRSFRTQPEGFAETVAYPVFRRASLLAVGGYDERMTRNQDNDMNHRLRRAGHRLYSTWKTSCEYRARAGVGSLLQYADGNGRWCGISARRAPASLGTRHYVPALFTAAVGLGTVLAIGGAMVGSAVAVTLGTLPVAAHLFAGHAASVHLAARERDPRALLLPTVLIAFHLRYGWRFFQGLFSRETVGPTPSHALTRG